MSLIKSFSVGNGDMFYIDHNSDNFTIIDCCLSVVNAEGIIAQIEGVKKNKAISRFISTHPDQDHFQGLELLDSKIDILNFYCVKNNVLKETETDDFKHYKSLRGSSKAFNISENCTRRWMNLDSEERGSSGINILWPDVNNEYFQETLRITEEGGRCNNISPIIKYGIRDGITALWMGDMETGFMESIENAIDWPKINVLFAPHHGRDEVPKNILDILSPEVIILGEAPAEYLNYYQNYNTITQNSSWDVELNCLKGRVDFYVSNAEYSVDFLENDSLISNDYYIGTLHL